MVELKIIILGSIAINIDKYILFMNMDIDTYKIFGVYAFIQMFFQLLLKLSLCKLYFEKENKRANKYSLVFNLINFLSLIIMSIITKEPIKFAEISMFIIYLFGFKNSFDFGEKYILAISFGTLITDTQWDISDAIKTVAQIDIAKKEFSYKAHMKNSRKLVWLLIISSIIMWILLYPFYKVDIIATLIIVGIELICMYLYPVYITKLTFVQMEYSAMKATISKQIANTLRIFCSFIASPFCTSIGLVVSVIYQLVSMQYIISKNKLNMEMKY